MPRQAPQIRDAVPEDAASLLALWKATARSVESTEPSLPDAACSLANIAADPDQRLLVAVHEDEVVAAMQLTRGQINPLVLESVVHTSFLRVLPHYRRHGFGHALLEVAVTWAEEKDVSQITAITDGDRDTNRFFARLGMTTLASARHASTASLRKKLTSDRSRASGGNRHLVEVLAQRRSMRRRQANA